MVKFAPNILLDAGSSNGGYIDAPECETCKGACIETHNPPPPNAKQRDDLSRLWNFRKRVAANQKRLFLGGVPDTLKEVARPISSMGQIASTSDRMELKTQDRWSARGLQMGLCVASTSSP